jgi:hypothetical protein
MLRKLALILLCFSLHQASYAQSDLKDLELLEQEDADFLNNNSPSNAVDSIDGSTKANAPSDLAKDLKPEEVDVSDLEEVDELEALKSDIGDILLDDPELEQEQEENGDILNIKGTADTVPATPGDEGQIVTDDTGAPKIFDTGLEEKRLLEISQYVIDKIPENEWNELATKSEQAKYVVQEGDWLWKIAQSLFGSGFYYSKIWSLNPQITNPHEIEPGMVLIFDTGDASQPPKVSVGEFPEATKTEKGVNTLGLFDWEMFGDEAEPPWFKSRQNLMNDGIFFQYASDETYEDLADFSKAALEREYEKYEPPIVDIVIQEPSRQVYDDTGFDKNSTISFDIKEGFYLNTFVTTNVVQDLGVIEHIKKEGVFIHRFDVIYVKFDDSAKIKPGDRFSVYSMGGEVSHPISDREGYQYTISAQVKTIRQKDHLWECIVTEVTGLVQRKDRLTVYTPKINRIIKTFNKRTIEAAVIRAYHDTANGLSYGDVVYLDRGRADGVEMGNVFELYSFVDRGTDKKITPNPTYKIGEVTVISLTDNFATALITNSSVEIALGNLAITKTEEQAARVAKIVRGQELTNLKNIEVESLDELDVELNLDDNAEDLLEKADQVQLTEDELEELERQERERSVIKDHERDLKELERLESEITQAEQKLNEKKIDEDKYLEQQDLERLEKIAKKQDPDAFESIDEIEKDIGYKYLDEDINSQENPYGLTEFDLEEIDELLNTDSL